MIKEIISVLAIFNDSRIELQVSGLQFGGEDTVFQFCGDDPVFAHLECVVVVVYHVTIVAFGHGLLKKF